MVVDLHSILEDLKAPLSYSDDSNRLRPGALLASDTTVKEILSLTDTMNSKTKKEQIEPDAKTKFYLFLLTVNKHFDLKKNKPEKDHARYIKSLAALMGIDQETYDIVMKFYHSDKPYVDKANTAYIAFELSNQLIRSKGINVYFTNRSPGEIIYLKYVEAYDLLLAKTFIETHSYNSIKEEIISKELNVITEDNYTELNYEMPSFSDLKTQLKNFNPLQRVEVSETGYNPRITLDPEKGMITVSGASSPISTTAYFEPIFEWLNLFDMSGKDTLNIYFHFKYYNTYTSKFLVNFVWKCNTLSKKGKNVSFYWYYDMEDDEMREFGEYLQTQFHEENKFYILETF
jgi:hypothetical protein